MQASQNLLSFITNEEGLVTRAYRDPAGVLTIGVGHTNAAGGFRFGPGTEITREQAMDILRTDLVKFIRRTEAAMPRAARHEIEGGTSFDFNTGAINKASWVRRWREQDFEGAKSAIMLWVKAGGRRLPGLVARRKRERDIIFYNKWPDNISRVQTHDYQAGLVELGYLSTSTTLPAVYLDALKNFQRDNGLRVDGIYGPATRSTMQRVIHARRAAKVGSGGAGLGGLGGASLEAAGNTQGAVVMAAVAVGIVVLVVGGAWLWRNRGRFLPPPKIGEI